MLDRAARCSERSTDLGEVVKSILLLVAAACRPASRLMALLRRVDAADVGAPAQTVALRAPAAESSSKEASSQNPESIVCISAARRAR